MDNSDIIRHLMVDARGINQRQLAEKTGIAESTISEILNGKRKLNVRHIKILSKFFKVESNVFFRET